MSSTFFPLSAAHRRAITLAVALSSCLPAAQAQQPAEGVTNLAPITVTSPVDNEATIGYQPKRSFSATKTDTPLLETPMSVQIVPREVLDDQQVLTLRDAIRNVSGVVQANYEYYDLLQIRGFENGYASNFRDGLPLWAITGHEVAFVDRVEVIKGPASMLYGRIDPGGLVNKVTKRPQADGEFNLQQQAGSYRFFRSVAEATGSLSEDNSVLYRAVGVHSQSESFMDQVEKRNTGALVGFSFKPNARFAANVSFETQDVRFVDTEDIGIPILGDRALPLRRSTFLGDPVGNMPNRSERVLAAFDWTYALNDAWKITQRFHWDKRDEQQLTFWSNGFDGVATLDRGLWFVHPERETFATNLDLAGDVELGGMRHRILIGGDWFRMTSDWHGFSNTTAAVPSINIYQPTYGISYAALKALPEDFFYTTRDSWYGIYLQDQLSVDEHWDILVGGRYDWAKTGFGQTGTSLADAKAALVMEKDKAFSPRAGILYKLSAAASLYASYAESFGTNNARSASGSRFDPERARQWEVGAKGNLLNGQLSASMSIFKLDKTNILTPDISTADPTDQIALGKVRNQGVELDLAGQLSNRVSLIASYTYSDTEIRKDNAGDEGNRMANVPRHAGSVWLKYDTGSGVAEGWQFGAGAYFRSQRQGDNANSWQLPGYGTIEAMLGYRLPVAGNKVLAQINVQNLLDKTYIDRSGFSAAKYGAPRTLTGSIKVDF